MKVNMSDLITDMIIGGADQDEMARVIQHSMTVIDAKKHNLDCEQSAIDNRVSELIQKYQG